MKIPSLSIPVIILMLFNSGCNISTQQPRTENSLSIEAVSNAVSGRLSDAVVRYEGMTNNPRSLDEEGELDLVRPGDWTSGFYPGCLWYAWEIYGDSSFLQAAKSHTEILENEKLNGTTHDMGFKMFCSYGNGYRLTGDLHYKEVLIESAYTLITRFNETVGCIRSWDHNGNKWKFPVIIDNMMNLELLFWAFQETNDSIFYNICISHADKTMANHFRENNSSYHVIGYNPETGEVEQKNTHQGYAHESAWSRGQAWGLYGFTLMYRETGDIKYLKQAEKIHEFIFSHKNLPPDLIPYWDLDAPGIPDEPRDASSAAIIASALYELGTYVDAKNSEEIYEHANSIMESLSSENYFCSKNSKHAFLLDHSTGQMLKNSEIDVPIIYADYYFIEALYRKINSENADDTNQ